MADVHVFGVRHHGPGSGRALRRALDAVAPDRVVVEGPPEATPLLALLGDADLRPPVALSLRLREDPAAALVVPFADWSPEWVAARWASEHGANLIFADRATAARLREPSTVGEADEEALGLLADLGGCPDIGAWWDAHVEEVDAGPEVFDAVLDAMRAARDGGEANPATLRREAALRVAIRAEAKLARRAVAVVCGAWHAPAMTLTTTAAADRASLAGDARGKVDVTWIPWSHRRLAADGYAAGWSAPEWAMCLFEAGPDAAARYAARWSAAARAAGHDGGAAASLDLVRLADRLAEVRGRRRAGCDELDDAARAVFGDAVAGRIIDGVRIGERLGKVPDAAATPLGRDLFATLRSVRVATSPTATLDVDLRDDVGGRRSRLFHRLVALELPMVTELEATSQGSFRERWRVGWNERCDEVLRERATWGDTVPAAATAVLVATAGLDGRMEDRCAALDTAIRADLPVAVEEIAASLLRTAAVGRDTVDLFDAAARVARAARFHGRTGDAADLDGVAAALFARGRLTLPEAARRLDDDAARLLTRGLAAGAEAVGLLACVDLAADWAQLLERLCRDNEVPPRVRGWATRAALDRDAGAALDRWWFECSAPDPTDTARWLEGLLEGGDATLLYDADLTAALDAWLVAMPPALFERAMPPLRRAFAGVDPDVKRHLLAPQAAAAAPAARDRDRADAVLPALRLWLGDAVDDALSAVPPA